MKIKLESLLYRKIVSKYGLIPQLDQVIEESAELIQAINKLKRRKPNSLQNLIEEIADIEIMLGQLKYILKCTEKVEDKKNLKIIKLIKKLNS